MPRIEHAFAVEVDEFEEDYQDQAAEYRFELLVNRLLELLPAIAACFPGPLATAA